MKATEVGMNPVEIFISIPTKIHGRFIVTEFGQKLKNPIDVSIPICLKLLEQDIISPINNNFF